MDVSWVSWAFKAGAALLVVYLFRVNQLLNKTPDEVRKLAGPRWTPTLLKETYEKLKENPIDYTDKLPPKLDRRYIVTGGSGLVGGFIVLQLLARGTPPAAIRILDIRKSERNDMQSGAVTECDFAQTDISSRASVDAAFSRPWPSSSIASLPLTVFHTAAVILASERSASAYGFPESVNVKGTMNVLSAAKAAGASVFSSTSSASIAIRPVEPFVAPWESSPREFFQVLDTKDFQKPLLPREGYFGNYPASKAFAERLVCDADSDGFRSGCIRPANGVYGNPTDNTVGDPLSRSFLPTWVSHIIQSFVHGANVAVAHLQHEAVLVLPDEESARFSGRPFVVTDPNPPIRYGDLYLCIKTLSVFPFTAIHLPPVLMLLLSHFVEIYAELQTSTSSFTILTKILPRLEGDIKHLKPGIFSICTHLVGSNSEISKPTSQDGLGYTGVMTTLEGMVLELMEWNEEHKEDAKTRKPYTTSVALAEKLQKLAPITQ